MKCEKRQYFEYLIGYLIENHEIKEIKKGITMVKTQTKLPYKSRISIRTRSRKALERGGKPLDRIQKRLT